MGFRKFFVIVGILVALLQPIKSDYYRSNLCACTREFSPICASNGITYQNGCLFDCAKQSNLNLCVRSYGECIQISVFNVPVMETVNTCACPFYLQPVCGNDGRTYSNQCEFNCARRFNANLQAIQCYNKQLQAQPSFSQAFAPPSQPFAQLLPQPQPPPQPQPQPQQQQPQPPAQAEQFPPPFAPSQQLPQLPPPQPIPPQVNTINGCACPYNFDPVCGSDGRTFSNECEFNCAKTFNANLQLVSRGKCNGVQPQLTIQPQFQVQPQPQPQPQPQFPPQPQPQPQFPPQPQPPPQPQFQPQPQPQPQDQGQPAVSQASACGCPYVLDYVCGSDGRSYANGCELNCARRYNSNLRMHSKGKCNGNPGNGMPAPMQPAPAPVQPVQGPPMSQPLCNNCPYNLDELCGNDGRTYSNQCQFNCAKQYNGNLGVVSRGRCNGQNQLSGWFTG